MNHSEEIYLAAKNKNKSAIEALRAQGFSIDQCIPNQWPLTAAGRLAEEGDRASAEFLRRLGANIHWIGYGAGRGGEKTLNYAERLRSKGADVDWIAQGAAETGKLRYAKFLLKDHNANPDLIAAGVVRRGKNHLVEKLSQEIPLDYSAAIYEAGKLQNLIYITHLLSKASDMHLEHLLHSAFIGITLTETIQENTNHSVADRLTLKEMMGELSVEGCFDIENIQLDEVSELLTPEIAEAIAEGAALGGHIEFAEKLRLHYALPKMSIILHAARGGHFDYAETLSIADYEFYKPYLILGAIEGHHYDYLWQLIQTEKITLAEVIQSIQCFEGTLELNILVTLLMKINNEHFRESLLEEGLKLNKYDAQTFEYASNTSKIYHNLLKIRPHPAPWGCSQIALFQAYPEGKFRIDTVTANVQPENELKEQSLSFMQS